MKRTIYLGWDSREETAFAVAHRSLIRHMRKVIPVDRLALSELRDFKLYRRPFEWREVESGQRVMWDIISDAPQSTEHANSRFLVPALAMGGWALFADCDVLFRCDVNEMFNDLDPAKALYCVQHKHEPGSATKMLGQVQSKYSRKNWSSVMAINCSHPANAALTVEMANTLPGRDLHAFCWLEDDDLIGALDPAWNYLVGTSDPAIDAKIAHFTEGTPDMPGYENCRYADEWRAELTGDAFRGAARLIDRDR